MGTNYVKKARTVRLPVVTSGQINTFSGGASTQYGSQILNGIVLQYPDGTYYVTQRPTVGIHLDPDDESVSDNKGRGVYYWDQEGAGLYVETGYVNSGYVEGSDTPALYIVNNAEVYHNSYATATGGGSMTAGVRRVYMEELGNNLVISDPENNQMWMIKSTDADYLISMQTYSQTDDGISFDDVADTITNDGVISFAGIGPGDTITVTGSTSNDGTYTVSTVSDTVIATVEAIPLTEVAGDTVTIATTNYTALPQNNSKTLAYGLAVLDQTMYVLATDGTVWGSAIGDTQDWDDALNVITAEREEDQGVFISKHHDHIVVFGARTIEFMYDAANPTGSPLGIREDIAYNIGCADPNSVWQAGDIIYFLGRNLSGQEQIYKLEDFKIVPLSNSNFSSYFSSGGYTFIGSGFTAGGISYYVLTVSTLANGEVSPIETHVYNSDTNIWTEWDYAGATTSKFPLISFTKSSGVGYGQFTTGEILTVRDNYTPTEEDTALTMRIRLDNFDNGSRDWKFAHFLRYVGDETVNANTITVKWSDDNNASYSSGRTINIDNSKDKLSRLGRFKSRSHEITYSGTEQIRIEALDLDITEGTH